MRHVEPRYPGCHFVSKDKWHKDFHLLLISGIGVRKMPEQEPFLLLELDPETDANHNDPQKTTKPPISMAEPETHQQKTSVNRMPHEAIRSRPHEFMPLLESDIAAPVAGQRPARLDRHEQSKYADQNSQDPRPICLRNQCQIHWQRQSFVNQQKPAQADWSPMTQSGQQALPFRRRLHSLCADGPIQENNPARDDD